MDSLVTSPNLTSEVGVLIQGLLLIIGALIALFGGKK